MIFLFSGTPGSGKSLHIASMLYWRLKNKKFCIANFEFNSEKCKKNADFIYLDNNSLNPEVLKNYSVEYFKKHKFKEGAITLVIDECQLLFNSREWNKKGRFEWLSFFSQHRKYGFDVFLICQFDMMIDRQIRSLIEYEYIHRKVGNFGFLGKFLSFLMGGKLFVAVKVWYPLKEKIGSEFFHAKKRFYQLYNSYDDFKSNVQEE